MLRVPVTVQRLLGCCRYLNVETWLLVKWVDSRISVAARDTPLESRVLLVQEKAR